ncbi:MAG: hypothetical protein HUN04_05580 [Desulfobacter sp.]|nr:MAG: hypothetical protein HUN04_05580 [Desulfobacter sp.]
MKAESLPASTQRVARIRERIINAPQEVCVERARYITGSMARHWDAHPLTRMSRAFGEILNQIRVVIREDELIVGCRTAKLKGAPLFPENKNRWIRGDVDNFDRRQVQRALITPEEKEELKNRILPFWEGRSVEDIFEQRLDPDVAGDMDKYIFTFMLQITYGIGHFTMDHTRVLSRGLSGMIADARQHLDALALDDKCQDEKPGEKSGEKGIFYRAAIRSMEGVCRFAGRYARTAREMAGAEKNPVRRAELERVADICARVPEYPAESFHEAVQSVYFIHLAAQIETGGNSVSLGRLDQILYPYYQADIEAGRITEDSARELICLLFLKLNEIWNVLEEAYIPGGEGTEGKTTQNVTVGGVGRDGRDAANGLSHVILDAYASIRTVQPNFGVRLGPDTGQSPPMGGLFKKAAQYAREGVLLHFFNDRTIVSTLVKGGHTLEDARDYGVVGCLEPNAQGKTFGSTFAVQFNLMKCLELALSNGVDNIFGYLSGPETGVPETLSDFDRVFDAYDAQVSHFIGQMVKGIFCLDQTIADILPSPFASSMIQGPMDKGMDLTRGGAVYNATGVQFMGFSNTADSLFALKRAVFEEKRFTLEELSQWLAEDWTDAEDKREFLLSQVPKYGNDHGDADAMAAKVADHLALALEGRKHYRGGAFWPGIFSVGFHITMGAFTGASPDGRWAGDILGNGITPSNGVTFEGPTALMNSVTKLPLDRIYNGANLNMRFDGKSVDPDLFCALIRAYFRRGGAQVQFNMVNKETLCHARDNPELYPDLVVRISGYSALFTKLSDIAQEEIINRFEFSF